MKIDDVKVLLFDFTLQRIQNERGELPKNPHQCLTILCFVRGNNFVYVYLILVYCFEGKKIFKSNAL